MSAYLARRRRNRNSWSPGCSAETSSVQPGPAGNLFSAYLRAVSAADLDPVSAAAAGNATLELLGAVLGSVIVPNLGTLGTSLR